MYFYMLYSHPGMAFTKQQIYEAVWHEKANGYFHAVENTIFQICKKIKKVFQRQELHKNSSWIWV